MQERVSQYQCINEENFAEYVPIVDEYESRETLNDIANLASGYIKCIEESIRYLIQVEKYSKDDPAILALEQHLRNSCEERLTNSVMSK